MIKIQNAALAHHGVVVEILLESFPELHRPFVEQDVPWKGIIRADDGRIPPRVARSDPAFLEHRDIRDAMLLRKVVRGVEPVPTTPDEHNIVGSARSAVTPCG